MTLHDLQKLQQAFRSFVDLETWQAPFAVTLSLKQARQETPNGPWAKLTPEWASENFRQFMNRLNAKVWRNAAKRHGVLLNVFPIVEGTKDKRFHFHAVIDCPRPELMEIFPELIEQCWLKTHWGYDQIDIKPNADNGWIRYITKLRDKQDFSLSIDIANIHIDRKIASGSDQPAFLKELSRGTTACLATAPHHDAVQFR